eukprot:1143795-Pelagomonas_calceolata.AAC.6
MSPVAFCVLGLLAQLAGSQALLDLHEKYSGPSRWATVLHQDDSYIPVMCVSDEMEPQRNPTTN